ncbi:hypothetical protein Vadar_006876 [Vaccinium darrowii]|uniref:Uncharacterized protein n=1 Tax=Vaccinium darrowii TaxID=229202 RepID=A0ACB7Z1W4_9ERIC|nr:hypothetical protein Vadar_006876 [Vaccinium darrowii]
MGKTPCCDKRGLKKGPWTAEEDKKLIDYIQKHGHGRWRTMPKNAGLRRCGKSCRLRWTNYLRPDIKRGRFSGEEEEIIIQIHSIMGNKWSAIAQRLPGRTDNEIKNYWNTHIRRRLLRMGIDPVTHTPRLDLPAISSLYNSSQPNAPSNMLGDHPQMNNPNLLTPSIAPSSSQRTTMNFLPQNFQENQSTNPHAQNQLHAIQENQPHTTIQDFQANMDQFSINTTNFSCPNSMPSLCNNINEDQCIDIAYDSLSFPEYSNQNFCQLLLAESQMYELDDTQNFGFGSVISAPLASSIPLNSATSYINGSAEDDQRDNYCSNGDIDAFM